MKKVQADLVSKPQTWYNNTTAKPLTKESLAQARKIMMEEAKRLSSPEYRAEQAKRDKEAVEAICIVFDQFPDIARRMAYSYALNGFIMVSPEDYKTLQNSRLLS